MPKVCHGACLRNGFASEAPKKCRASAQSLSICAVVASGLRSVLSIKAASCEREIGLMAKKALR